MSQNEYMNSYLTIFQRFDEWPCVLSVEGRTVGKVARWCKVENKVGLQSCKKVLEIV